MDSNNNNWQEMPYQGTENNTTYEQTTTYNYDTTSNYTVAPPQYNYEYQAPTADTKDGLCIAALVLGIVGFFLNPVYVCSGLAIIFGVIGYKANGSQAKMGQIGMILGIANLGIQLFMDIMITVLTFGTGIFSFCC